MQSLMGSAARIGSSSSLLATKRRAFRQPGICSSIPKGAICFVVCIDQHAPLIEGSLITTDSCQFILASVPVLEVLLDDVNDDPDRALKYPHQDIDFPGMKKTRIFTGQRFLVICEHRICVQIFILTIGFVDNTIIESLPTKHSTK